VQVKCYGPQFGVPFRGASACFQTSSVRCGVPWRSDERRAQTYQQGRRGLAPPSRQRRPPARPDELTGEEAGDARSLTSREQPQVIVKAACSSHAQAGGKRINHEECGENGAWRAHMEQMPRRRSLGMAVRTRRVPLPAPAVGRCPGLACWRRWSRQSSSTPEKTRSPRAAAAEPHTRERGFFRVPGRPGITRQEATLVPRAPPSNASVRALPLDTVSPGIAGRGQRMRPAEMEARPRAMMWDIHCGEADRRYFSTAAALLTCRALRWSR